MKQEESFERKILICTWGKPWKNWDLNLNEYFWQPVDYELDNVPTPQVRSSLPVIVSRINPDEVYIIVLDTVITWNEETIKSYEHIVERVKKKYNEFLHLELSMIDPTKITIMVMPGVGAFQNCVIDGKMIDFYAVFLYEMIKAILSNHSVQNYSFFLDLTHGINFMPTLAYRAIKDIGSILAITNNVNLTVYNSDPFTPASIHLNVNTLEKVQLQAAPYGELLTPDRPRLLSNKALPQEKYREIDRQLREYDITLSSASLNVFLGSLYNGLPLLLFHEFPDVNEILNLLDLAVQFFHDAMTISFDGDQLHISRNCSLARDYTILTRCWLEAAILDIENKKEVPLSDIDRVKSSVFGKNDKIKSMIDRDFNDILYKIKNFQQDETLVGTWIPLNRLLGQDDQSSLDESLFKRNFLAHSGFESTCVEFYLNPIEGNEEGPAKPIIKLRYKEDPELLGKIRKYSTAGMRRSN